MSESLEQQVKEIWNKAHKEIITDCGEDKGKLALTEVIGLRKIAASILSKRIMCDMAAAANSSKRKLTR